MSLDTLERTRLSNDVDAARRHLNTMRSRSISNLMLSVMRDKMLEVGGERKNYYVLIDLLLIDFLLIDFLLIDDDNCG